MHAAPEPDDLSTAIATFVTWAPIVPLVFLVYFSVRLWTLLSPMRPLARGDYAAARRGFEKTTRFWLPSAAQHVASAMTMESAPSVRLGWKASLRFDPELQRSMESYFRGWYFYKVGEMQRARLDFELACRSPLVHVCTVRARTLLTSASRPSFDIEDAPSSLSPHEFP